MASKHRCINCGAIMKQQFIGLKHCRCGVSWKKDVGYFERTSGMTFHLKKIKKGTKTKQVPMSRMKHKN